MLASIVGPDLLIVLLVVLVIFGGTQIPKLARSLGSAHREFQRGLEEQEPSTTATSVARETQVVDGHVGPMSVVVEKRETVVPDPVVVEGNGRRPTHPADGSGS